MIDRIDAAIKRLRAKFDDPSVNHVGLEIGIENLKEKRQRVLDGTYQPGEDAQRFIAAIYFISAAICENTKSREKWYKGE